MGKNKYDKLHNQVNNSVKSEFLEPQSTKPIK